MLPETLVLILTLFYNAVLLAVDVAAWRWLRRKPSVKRWLAMMLAVGAVAVVLAGVTGLSIFGLFRNLSYGLFGHVALLLLLSVFWMRKVSKLFSAACGTAALVLWIVAFDAFLIEPTWLEVTHYRLPSKKLTRPVRIVLVADLQTDQCGDYERRVLRLAADQKPDLLLFAGDYVQCLDPASYDAVVNEINRHVRQLDLNPAAGMFAVQGNVDRDGWQNMFDRTDVTVVPDTQTSELDGLLLTCLCRDDSFRSDLTIENGRPDRFHVVLGHSPNYALGQVHADLLLAGHTYGGQVRLPVVGPLLTLSRVPRSWAAGLTDLPDGGKLLVSRGIGMERGSAPRLRFLCRPQLAVIDLVPEAGGSEN